MTVNVNIRMNKIKGGWWVTASCLHNQLQMYIHNLVGGSSEGNWVRHLFIAK